MQTRIIRATPDERAHHGAYLRSSNVAAKANPSGYSAHGFCGEYYFFPVEYVALYVLVLPEPAVLTEIPKYRLIRNRQIVVESAGEFSIIPSWRSVGYG